MIDHTITPSIPELRESLAQAQTEIGALREQKADLLAAAKEVRSLIPNIEASVLGCRFIASLEKLAAAISKAGE